MRSHGAPAKQYRSEQEPRATSPVDARIARGPRILARRPLDRVVAAPATRGSSRSQGQPGTAPRRVFVSRRRVFCAACSQTSPISSVKKCIEKQRGFLPRRITLRLAPLNSRKQRGVCAPLKTARATWSTRPPHAYECCRVPDSTRCPRAHSIAESALRPACGCLRQTSAPACS